MLCNAMLRSLILIHTLLRTPVAKPRCLRPNRHPLRPNHQGRNLLMHLLLISSHRPDIRRRRRRRPKADQIRPKTMSLHRIAPLQPKRTAPIDRRTILRIRIRRSWVRDDLQILVLPLRWRCGHIVHSSQIQARCRDSDFKRTSLYPRQCLPAHPIRLCPRIKRRRKCSHAQDFARLLSTRGRTMTHCNIFLRHRWRFARCSSAPEPDKQGNVESRQNNSDRNHG